MLLAAPLLLAPLCSPPCASPQIDKQFKPKEGVEWAPNYHGTLYNLTDDGIQVGAAPPARLPEGTLGVLPQPPHNWLGGCRNGNCRWQREAVGPACSMHSELC